MTPIQSVFGFALLFLICGLLSAKNGEQNYEDVPLFVIFGFFIGLLVECLAR